MLTLISSFALAATPGELRTYSTLRSIGVEWDISGDAQLDATATVRFRETGAADWREAFGLVRVQHNGADMLAGSVMFLDPGQDHHIELSLADPDGTSEVRTVDVATRPLPTKPDGQVFHVAPGASGDGSEGAPFGLDQARSQGQPADTFLLHVGDYGVDPHFDVGGTEDAYVVWQAAGDGEVTMTGARIDASHVWLEGLTIRDSDFGLVTDNAPNNVVVSGCSFTNNHYSITINDSGSRGWTIMDNTIVGDNVVGDGSFSGEGIELGETHDHVVMYNRISQVADGVSYPGQNVDIYGNDIFNTSDDGIEADNGLANVRMWGNRIANAYHNAITFQAQDGAPWYILRNQVIGADESVFKYRGADRHVVVNNTFVTWDNVVDIDGEELLNAYVRNNLFISAGGGQIYDFRDGQTLDWTDIDYNAFDWNGDSHPFSYDGSNYTSLADYQAASGLDAHSFELDAEACIPSLDVPGAAPTSVPEQIASLAGDCPAVDAGVPVANLSDEYVGVAPDIGAHELGAEQPHYGPRTEPDDYEDTGLDTDTDPPDTDTSDTGGSDTDTPGTDSGRTDSGASSGKDGCGCSAGGAASVGWSLGLLMLGIGRRWRG